MGESLLIIVPARGGSKRLPGKNLRSFGGKSLLSHTAEAIAGAMQDAAVLLSTDDKAIAAEGRRLGWRVPFLRPAALASDQATTIDVVLHALDFHRNETGADPELVMVLQPTSPLRGSACIRAAIELLGTREDADAVIGMVELHQPPARLYLSARNGIAEPVSGDLRLPVYIPNGAMYLARTLAVRFECTLYTARVLPLVMDTIRSIDIDTESDWRLAEAALTAPMPPDSTPSLARESLSGNVR